MHKLQLHSQKRIRTADPIQENVFMFRRAPLEKSGGQVLFLLCGWPDGMHEGGGVFVYRKVEAKAVMDAREQRKHQVHS